MDTLFLYAGIVVMLIVIVSDYVKRKYNYDMDNIDTTKLENRVKTGIGLLKDKNAISKSTGRRKLILLNGGDNKATVMATLRQIANVDYQKAKDIVEKAPSTVMVNISDREAILNKRALEYVGAKCEII